VSQASIKYKHLIIFFGPSIKKNKKNKIIFFGPVMHWWHVKKKDPLPIANHRAREVHELDTLGQVMGTFYLVSRRKLKLTVWITVEP
jgi:hypothetical protein